MLSERARPLRFALTGGSAGLLQLALLAFLTGRGWPALTANAAAFLVAAQLNFALSTTLTWRDRRGTASLWRRWLLFHGSIAAMAAVNGLVFMAARVVIAPLPASAAGIAVAALGNFVVGDRVVFQSASRGRGFGAQMGGAGARPREKTASFPITHAAE